MTTKADKHSSIAIINHNKYQEKFWNLLIIIFLIIVNEIALIKQIRSTVNNSHLMIQKDEKWKYINSSHNSLRISGLKKFIKHTPSRPIVNWTNALVYELATFNAKNRDIHSTSKCCQYKSTVTLINDLLNIPYININLVSFLLQQCVHKHSH